MVDMSLFFSGYTKNLNKFLNRGEGKEGLEEVLDLVYNDSMMYPLSRKNELRHLIKLVEKTKPEVIMEVGTDKGGTFYCWCKLFPCLRKAIALEIRGIPFKAYHHHFKEIDFKWVERNSTSSEAVEEVRQFLGNDKLDFLLINGCHTLPTIQKDYKNYSQFVKKGGIIALHDINPVNEISDPRKVFEKERKGVLSTGIIDTLEITEPSYLERIKRGLPPRNAYEGWLRIWRDTSAGYGLIWKEIKKYELEDKDIKTIKEIVKKTHDVTLLHYNRGNILSLVGEEPEVFYKIAKNQEERGNILEVGTGVGGASLIFASGISERNMEEKVYTLDSFKEIPKQKDEFNRLIRTFPLSKYIVSIEGDSKVTLKEEGIIKKPVRLIFIDGSHLYEDIYSDISLSLKYLMKGGLILIHDYYPLSGWEGVRRAANQFLDKGLILEIGRTELTLIAKKGE